MMLLGPHNHTQENGVPSYPGFENDVYKLISDYFLQFQNKTPLLTYALYDAFITCFIRAELFDFNSRLYSAKMANASRSRLFQQPQPTLMKTVSFATQSPMFKMEDQYPFNASESVEDLILDILTPSTQRNRKWKPDSMGLNPRKNLFSSNKNACDLASNDKSLREVNHSFMNDSIFSAVPRPMSTNNYDVNRYTLPLYYETAFTGNETPITRVVSRTELKASLGKKSNSALKVRVPAASADAILDGNAYAYENPNLELSGSDLINHPKYSKILQSAELEQIGSPNVASSFWNYASSSAERVKTRSTKSSSPPVNGHASSSLLDDKFIGKPLRAYSAVNLTDASKMRDRQLLSSTLPVPGHKSPSPWTPARNSLAVYYANSPSLMTSDGKRLAIISFRLLTLLLPPTNRRHLQILLRFMAKTSKNDKLMLDVAASTRAVFKMEYPHIFWEKFGDEVPSFLDESKAKPKKEKKSWNVFKALRI
ncbi:unnamed protein product [Allacma fusca]|uniref:Uncharacterized protein n=1 Tax=Allacma fusca TaxID=39272 RepID=A0A8J2LK76_9HEXA|nr:unnamed protein product [Allacma fusca]